MYSQPIKINVAQFDAEDEIQNSDKNFCTFYLHDSYIRKKISANVLQIDKDLETQTEKLYNQDYSILKSAITGVIADYLEKYDYWAITIYAKGTNFDMDARFGTMSECMRFYDIILKWITNG